MSNVNVIGESEIIEVVELLFNDEGQCIFFELLEVIQHRAINYFLLTAYHDDEDDMTMPADVFIMQEVEKFGEKKLEPLTERVQMEMIFSKFKENNKNKFEFVE